MITFSISKLKGAGLENAELAGYQGKTIVVTAYAIQADGFADHTPAQIWNAYNNNNY